VLKNKRILWALFAVVFVVLLFLIKNNFFREKSQEEKAEEAFAKETLLNLVNKDTDGDKILDWEENLWGTNPIKEDTDDDGKKDDVEIAEMKKNNGVGGENGESGQALSQTDKFSQELFATVATLSQAGEIDQETIDKLSDSLAVQIASSPIRKVYAMKEINVLLDNSVEAIKKYDKATTDLSKKYQFDANSISILAESIINGEEIDAEKLTKLDPIIKEGKQMINELIRIPVPSEFADLHLKLTNAFERLVENLSDIRKFENDVMPALSAVSQYENNSIALEEAIKKLNELFVKKLKS